MLRMLSYFARRYPGHGTLVLVCLLLAGVMQGIGFSSMLPVITLAAGGGEAGETTGLEVLIDDAFAWLGIAPTLGTLLIVIVSAIWTKSLLVMLSKRQVGYTVARVSTDLRLELLRAMLGTRWSFTARQPAGGVANAVATEANRAAKAFEAMAMVVTCSIEATVYALVALAISWQVTLAAVCAAAFTITSLSALVRMANRAGQKQTLILGSMIGRLTEFMSVLKLLKATGREEAFELVVAKDSQRLNRQARRGVFSRSAMRALQEPVVISLVGVGLFVAISRYGLPLSAVLVLVLAFTRVLGKANEVQRKLQTMLADSSALWSIVSMIERAKSEQERSGGLPPPPLEKSLRFRDVSVHYDGRAVLEHASFELEAGRIHALVGPSGAGKTTLVDVITGLIEPETGSIEIDGQPLKTLDLRQWRRRVGYVPQELLMLHDSVRLNVTLGDPDVDDAQVEAALRDAHAWDFVAKLPGGIEQSVGERGATLSGGQRQRIAIARALVHRPRLLILDEATAGLDHESEAAVWSAVEGLRGRTTVVAISHQPALLTIAERVLRIQDGRVRESAGTQEVA